MPSSHPLMEQSPLLGEGLSELMQQSGQSCLTILCPLHPSNPDRSSDRLSLKHLLQQAALLIRKTWEPPVAEQLLQQLEDIHNKVDLVHTPKGLGIYLNPVFLRVDHYSFAVPPDVHIENRFPVRESLWELQNCRPTYLLSLSEKEIQLHQISNGSWVSISDTFFPHRVKDDFEYAKPVRSSSYAGHAHVKIFEQDKLEMQHVRLRDAYREIDTPLRPYVQHGEPLLLAGPDRDLSLFRQISQHSDRVIAQINGNYQVAHQELFKDKVAHAIEDHRRAQMQGLVSIFFEKWGSGLAKCGFADCWNAVEAGQGLQLIVERGYREAWYQSTTGQFSKQKTDSAQKLFPDAIDALMAKTIEKGGEVILVDNNLLTSAQRVALILRYP